jgi:hypothetical protein
MLLAWVPGLFMALSVRGPARSVDEEAYGGYKPDDGHPRYIIPIPLCSSRRSGIAWLAASVACNGRHMVVFFSIFG